MAESSTPKRCTRSGSALLEVEQRTKFRNNPAKSVVQDGAVAERAVDLITPVACIKKRGLNEKKKKTQKNSNISNVGSSIKFNVDGEGDSSKKSSKKQITSKGQVEGTDSFH